MYRLTPLELVSKRFIWLWSSLSFQAGFINSIGFLACQRYVSHVTGFGTQVGISLGRGQYLLALQMFSLPVTFICGAWLNGYWTVARKARGLTPRYNYVTLTMPAVLFLVMIAGTNGLLGIFGEPVLFAKDFLFLSGLSFVCGMQNACFATLTQGQIRTTHLTGISTDFGTDLSLILSGGLPDTERELLKGKNIMRAMTFSSFSLGALLSAVWDTSLEYWSLSIPICTSIGVAAIFLLVKYEIDHKNESLLRVNSAAKNTI